MASAVSAGAVATAGVMSRPGPPVTARISTRAGTTRPGTTAAGATRAGISRAVATTTAMVRAAAGTGTGSVTATNNSGNNNRRRERGGEAEPVIAEDDVLIPIAGILDVLDNYAFVRTTGYLPGSNDVYVSLSQVRKYGLRKGDVVEGAMRQPKDGERREKFNALVRLDKINGLDPEQSRLRPNSPSWSRCTRRTGCAWRPIRPS